MADGWISNVFGGTVDAKSLRSFALIISNPTDGVSIPGIITEKNSGVKC